MHAFIKNQRRRDLEKLSPAMWELLFDIQKMNGAFLPSASIATRRALVRKGLLQGWKLTPAGSEACEVEWRHDDDQPQS